MEEKNPIVGYVPKRTKTMPKIFFDLRKTAYEFQGRKLAKQGMWFRNEVAKTPELFPYLQSEENCDELAKFFVTVATKTALGEDNTGSYLVPDEIVPELFLLARNTSFALKYCTVYPMNSIRLNVPKENTKATVAWYAEGAPFAGAEGTFSQAALQARELVTLTSRKLGGMVTISNEMLEDSAVDIAGMLTEAFLYAIGQEIDNKFFNDTGTFGSGLLTPSAGFSTVLSGTAFSTITSTDLSTAISKLEEGDLRNARFVLNRMSAHYLRNIKDSSLRPIFTASNAGLPGTGDCYGFPVEVSENIASTDGTGKPFGVFGNFKKFIIGQHIRAEIKVDPFGLFNSNQTRFLLTSRWGFSYGNNNAFCRIING